MKTVSVLAEYLFCGRPSNRFWNVVWFFFWVVVISIHLVFFDTDFDLFLDLVCLFRVISSWAFVNRDLPSIWNESVTFVTLMKSK